ncbi:DegT/DnrJ/EryC1/StrS aminotransferase family protein [Bosea sp. (in: a-proteobacteria)]|uniref:DegT/DnrJ/EryC1/StrS family aminotransferase n=1 Tax=Bosea sp. (in: a-proteobacteria) TaxID=1871050 RepID=UPI002B4717AC|nr:DegT/DnrJ/EryC1/StrS aminotransferase family protein [Bosea sp. (in: a-proteobacteria)]WRH57682.1 MAG: DegT/DnrJ/EryC1/StrS aminotransferase family protein [Bosea sp. (in: a-proteobacteria)]
MGSDLATLPRLARDLTEPEPIPEAGIARAVELMRSGRLFRYGEMGADQNDVALLEQEFAAFVGRRYCVAVNSGGAALCLALKVLDLQLGEPVLVNGFTLAPVPGAILHAGGRPVLVEVGPDYVIDCEDLRAKARASGARILLLSHMRGHIADMDAVMAACDELGLLLVEDCAHALCAAWGGSAIGTFGAAAAFSAQTYKHLNAGEGGFLVLDDDDRIARAILHSGSYMLHAQHRSAPPAEVIAAWEERTPNFSMRMTALAAALLRPQLHDLPRRAARWNAIHDRIGAAIARSQHVRLPPRSPKERYGATSVQFSLLGFDDSEIAAVLERCAARGLPIKWFGAGRQRGFTSAPRHWRYAGEQGPMAQTHAILAGLCDIRTPLSLTDEDCDLVADILREAIETVVSARAETGKTGRAATG